MRLRIKPHIAFRDGLWGVAERLHNAARYTPKDMDQTFARERWELVADTIDLMIRKAILESDNRRALPTGAPQK